jgi:hypothetical protein
LSDFLHSKNEDANLPTGKRAKDVYTKDEVISLIKADRERLITFIEEYNQYGIRSLFDKVPIQMQQ